MLCVARNCNGRARLHLAVSRCILRRISALSGSGFLHSGLLRTGLGDRSRGLRERLLRRTGTAGRVRTVSLGCGGLHGAPAINRGRIFGFTLEGFAVMPLIITVDASLLVIVIIFGFATIKTLTQGIGQTKTTRPPGHTTQYGKNHEPRPRHQTKKSQKQAQYGGHTGSSSHQVSHTRRGRRIKRGKQGLFGLFYHGNLTGIRGHRGRIPNLRDGRRLGRCTIPHGV